MRHHVDPERRRILETAGRVGLALTGGLLFRPGLSLFPEAKAQTPPPQADQTIRIAPVSLEIAPGKIIKTTGYNGAVPGPALRLKEGQPCKDQRHQ